jgi:hypothetical protein
VQAGTSKISDCTISLQDAVHPGALAAGTQQKKKAVVSSKTKQCESALHRPILSDITNNTVSFENSQASPDRNRMDTKSMAVIEQHWHEKPKYTEKT